jgi:hypothetical protein
MLQIKWLGLSRYAKIHNDGWRAATTRNPLVTEMLQKLALTVTGGMYQEPR